MQNQAYEAARGGLVVSGRVEGAELHLTRTYAGQTQHKFLRADIHASTPDELRIAVHADLDYLWRVLEAL